MSKFQQQVKNAVPDISDLMAEAVEAVHEGRPLREVLEIPKGSIQSVLQNAFQLYERGDLEKAQTLAEGARSLDQDLSYPHLLLGDIYLRQGRLEESLESFEKARELAEDHWEASVRAAEVKLRLDQYSDASKLLEQLDSDDCPDEIRRRVQTLSDLVAKRRGRG